MASGMTQDEGRERLEKLLVRRENYFLISDTRKKMFRSQFEEMQQEIIRLKVHFEIWQDELDMFEVRFNYWKEPEKMQICQDASDKKELRWLTRRYSPETQIASYVALVNKQLSDPWLAELFERHKLWRDGFMKCPWPTKIHKIEEREDDGGNGKCEM